MMCKYSYLQDALTMAFISIRLLIRAFFFIETIFKESAVLLTHILETHSQFYVNSVIFVDLLHS